MTALTIDNIPTATLNHGINLRCNIVVTLWRPGVNSNNTHPLDYLLSGKWGSGGMGCSCQKCHINSTIHKTTSDFVDMCFCTSHVGKVACGHHQHIERTCFSRHQTCLFLESLFPPRRNK